MPIADQLFTNATFHTLNPATSGLPPAEALAAWRGRIVAVGTRSDVDALVGGDALDDLLHAEAHAHAHQSTKCRRHCASVDAARAELVRQLASAAPATTARAAEIIAAQPADEPRTASPAALLQPQAQRIWQH